MLYYFLLYNKMNHSCVSLFLPPVTELLPSPPSSPSCPSESLQRIKLSSLCVTVVPARSINKESVYVSVLLCQSTHPPTVSFIQCTIPAPKIHGFSSFQFSRFPRICTNICICFLTSLYTARSHIGLPTSLQ